LQPFLIQLVDLTLIQLTNWRWSWRSTVIISMIFPILSIGALGIFARNSGPDALAYVVTGNIVLSLLFRTVGQVSNNFSYMRVVGMLDYFATLPIYRSALILASVFAFLLLSLPSTLWTLAMGALILRIPLAISPWIIVVIPLVSLTLCGLGALIGLVGRTPQEVDSISTLTTFLLLAVGPVIIPADALPGVVQVIGLFSPATYAASALRQEVLGLPDRIPLAVDMLALTVLLLGFLWLVAQRIDWRER
jgi:ABC-2 type transport system permease protein